MYCGSRRVEQFLGRLLVNVVHVGGAELLCFLVGLVRVRRLKRNAGSHSGLGRALVFRQGGLGSAGHLLRADLD